MRSGERGMSRGRVERVARMYGGNEEAARALGIAMRSFSRLCRQHDIETPYARRVRLRREAQGAAEREVLSDRPG